MPTNMVQGSFRLECHFSSSTARFAFVDLSDEQKSIVSQIGFGSVLRFPYYRRIDRKFYAWLLASVDTERMVLQVGVGSKIPITAESVHRLLGLPMGCNAVTGQDDVVRACAQIQVAKQMGLRNRPGLLFDLCSENHISQTKQCSTEQEKQHFARSFIAIVVRYLLSPRGQSGRNMSNVFPVILDAMDASKFNWCQFVVDEIRQSAVNVKLALMGRAPTLKLSGCLLFLQVLYFDSLPLAQNFNLTLTDPIAAAYTHEVVSNILKCPLPHPTFAHYHEFSHLLGSYFSKKTSRPSTSLRGRKRCRTDDEVIAAIGRLLARQGMPPTSTSMRGIYPDPSSVASNPPDEASSA
ncbi:hypothetical protein ACP70R_027847 [Stipagrostis hirtigluma subsp. patula]